MIGMEENSKKSSGGICIPFLHCREASYFGGDLVLRDHLFSTNTVSQLQQD